MFSATSHLNRKSTKTLHMKTFKYIALTLLSIILWAVFIIYGISDGFILKSLSKDESPEAFVEATKAQIDNEFVGNMAMVLVENGKVAEQFFHSEDKPVHENTIFQWPVRFGQTSGRIFTPLAFTRQRLWQ